MTSCGCGNMNISRLMLNFGEGVGNQGTHHSSVGCPCGQIKVGSHDL